MEGITLGTITVSFAAACTIEVAPDNCGLPDLMCSGSHDSFADEGGVLQVTVRRGDVGSEDSERATTVGVDFNSIEIAWEPKRIAQRRTPRPRQTWLQAKGLYFERSHPHQTYIKPQHTRKIMTGICLGHELSVIDCTIIPSSSSTAQYTQPSVISLLYTLSLRMPLAWGLAKPRRSYELVITYLMPGIHISNTIWSDNLEQRAHFILHVVTDSPPRVLTYASIE